MPPTQAPRVRKAPLTFVDPYSQQMIVAYTKGSDAPTLQELRPAPDAGGGTSKAVRVLQLVLLSSVAVMIWFMLSILKITPSL